MKSIMHRIRIFLFAAFVLTLAWACIAALVLTSVARHPQEWPLAFFIAGLAAIMLFIILTRGR
jgi:hypothetical protein